MEKSVDLGPYSNLVAGQLRDWEWPAQAIERQLRAERRQRPQWLRIEAEAYNAYKASAIEYAAAEGTTPIQAERAFDAVVDADPHRVGEDFEAWRKLQDETSERVTTLGKAAVLRSIPHPQMDYV